MLLMIIGSWTSVWGYGENTSYVYQNAGEKSASDWGNIIWTDANSAEVSFQAKKSAATAIGDLRVDAYINGSWTEILRIKKEELSKNTYKSFSVDVTGRNVSGLRFKNEGTYTRKIKDIKVTRATNITATTTSIDFGTRTINDASITKTASFSFNNTTYNQQVTGSCTDSHFTVSPVDVGATGSSSVNVTYSSTTPGVHSGTVTLSMKGATTSFTVSGSTTATYNFSATANPNNTAFGTVSASVANTSVTSTNTSEETTATFTATAHSGYEFVGWSTTQDATSYESTANPYQTTITNSNSKPGSTANKTLYAIFKPVFLFTATAEKINGSYGQVTSSVTQKILGEPSENSKTTQATFTATPNENCTFHGWYYDAAHTQKASDNATYTEDITNNKVGSTAHLTLYAWFKTNQTLTFNATTYEKNIVKGATLAGAATATASSGLSVSYTSSNSNVVSVNDTGDVTGVSVSNDDVTITALQPGNDEYNPASITRDFHVVSKKEITFTPSGFTGTSPTLHVEDQPSITVENEGDEFTYTSSDPEVVSISKDGTILTLTALKEGVSTVTLNQPETSTHSAVKQTYTITVKKIANTLQLTLPTQSAQVDGIIQVHTSGQNNTATLIMADITEQSLSSQVNNGENVITYENGTIKACNAGTARITFTQAATDTYEGFTSATFDITVTKIPNPIAITLNGGSATAIKLKYDETATLSYSSAHSDTTITVKRTSGSYTTLSENTITAGNAAGTDLYAVTQAETYKYEEGYATFSVRVNNTNEEEGYVLNDATEYSHGTGSGVVHTYELTGPGNMLYYQARRQSGAFYYDLYVEYSTDGSTWVEAQDNQDVPTSYKDFSCPIPEEARYVRFRFPAGGTLTKYIRNVKVPRVTYLRASTDDATDFGTVYTDETRQATFTVNYSTTNGGKITLNSSNAHFAVSATELAVNNHSDGTHTFKVTYTPSPNALGAESAVITISDLFYSKQFTLNATANKHENTLAVIENQNLKVDDEVTSVYTNMNSDATLSHNVSKEGVITFDAKTKTVKAVGAGEATLTFIQPENDTHFGTTKSVIFTVSKHDQTLSWNQELSSEDRTLKVGDELQTNTATATSGLAVTYSSSNDKVLKVDPTTGKITALAGGSNIAVTATQSGNDKYNEATSITRYFTVISKIDAEVVTSLSETGTNLLTLGETPFTIGCNATLTESNFTITDNENGYIETSFANNTLTITPVKVGGEVTITLTREEDDSYSALSKTYKITVLGPVLTLSPSMKPEVKFPGTEYSVVTLQRTLKEGYSSIALPFNTTVQNIVGDSYDASQEDWVAQLSAVTYNAQDRYTLYFKKMEGGTLEANQPYILHLAREVVNPVFKSVMVMTPEATAHAATKGAAGYANWKMYSNYTPGFVMTDKYGVVNAEKCLKLGGENSYLNAFTAYIASEGVPPAQTRTHFVTEEELTDILAPVEGTGRTEVYDLQGRRLNKPGQGIHLIRREDGTVRKIIK